MCVCVWCFWWKRWAARIADRLRSWHHWVCVCVRVCVTEHHQGPFDKLTQWQLWGDKVALSTLHGVKTAKCYTAVSFPGVLVLRGGVISTGTIRKIKLVQERHSASCETKQNSISTAALNFHKAKLINNYTPCFYCPNQKVELHDSPQIHLFPCRFALSTPKYIFDVGLVTGGKSMSQRWEPDLWITSAHNSRRNLVYWCHIHFFPPSWSSKTSVSQG